MSEKMKGAQNVSKPPSLTEEKPIDINNESDELTETVIIKKGN